MDRIPREFDVDKNSLALDVIKEIGIGGTFISHRHTVKTLKIGYENPKYLPEKIIQSG